MTRTIAVIILFVSFPLAALTAEAQYEPAAKSNAPSAQLTEGEVRKVDKDAKKITIRHGPLTNLDMPAMTMVFQVKDPAMLDQVKAGDKIRFLAEKPGGVFTVTVMEPAK